jgi:hypothetical protein
MTNHQRTNDMNTRRAKNIPQSLTNSTTLGNADGLIDRLVGQNRSITARAFAGNKAISIPIVNTSNAGKYNNNVGDLGGATTVAGAPVGVVARPVSTR